MGLPNAFWKSAIASMLDVDRQRLVEQLFELEFAACFFSFATLDISAWA
jgi:hypothetical protein